MRGALLSAARSALIMLPILLAGCSKSPDLFPLEVGKSWKYTVSSGMSKKVITLRVTGRASFAEAQGYELQSDMGNFRLAWKNGWLLAGSLAGTRYNPPLPILSQDSPATAKWKGTVHSMGRALEATADILQEKPSPRSKEADQGVKVIIKMQAGGKKFETESFYKPKLGLVEQTQRVDGLLTIAMRSL